ncbi:hypothetical protein [Paenibacillus graminis]|uniref:hypothetical protein n=1 Tax=Paenibacillus graminis TaxID=189425 RepID=UPI002DBE6B10|nr:hypothetical protein [Paenibacillus graminis]MEC0169010.1 hypothetical protein [Paenibacillus graminis]
MTFSDFISALQRFLAFFAEMQRLSGGDFFFVNLEGLQKLFPLKAAERTERLWKSGSGRLGLRIFTAKGNGKNLETTAIGTTVRSRSDHPVLTLILLKNKGLSQAAITWLLGQPL